MISRIKKTIKSNGKKKSYIIYMRKKKRSEKKSKKNVKRGLTMGNAYAIIEPHRGTKPRRKELGRKPRKKKKPWKCCNTNKAEPRTTKTQRSRSESIIALILQNRKMKLGGLKNENL